MLYVKTKLKLSPIHGIGIFADEFIAKGTLVWEFLKDFDVVLSPQQFELLSAEAKRQVIHYAYVSKKTGRYVLCSDDARFFNHSDTANTVCTVPEGATDESLVSYAKEDIYPDQELTNDYHEFDANDAI